MHGLGYTRHDHIAGDSLCISSSFFHIFYAFLCCVIIKGTFIILLKLMTTSILPFGFGDQWHQIWQFGISFIPSGGTAMETWSLFSMLFSPSSSYHWPNDNIHSFLFVMRSVAAADLTVLRLHCTPQEGWVYISGWVHSAWLGDLALIGAISRGVCMDVVCGLGLGRSREWGGRPEKLNERDGHPMG